MPTSIRFPKNAAIHINRALGACAVAVVFALSGAVSAHASDNNTIILASLGPTDMPSERMAHSGKPKLFGHGEQQFSDTSAFTKWNGVIKNFKKDFRASLQKSEVQDWMRFLSSIENEPRSAQIKAVNEYMNKMEFVADNMNYGTRDYWATPMEFLKRGGDCEDYVIAKYISLRSLGFSEDELRLAVVYDQVMRMPHAILVVYEDGAAKILDNQNPAVLDSIEITRYKPIYSISQMAWWRH